MITPPAVFGHEFSGTIVQVGAGVQHFREGMRVVANNSAPCYRCYYCRRNLPNLCDDLLFINGAYAEYIVVPERVVHTNLLAIPTALPAPWPNGAAGLRVACLDQATLHPGDTVVVNGDGPSGLMLAAMAAWRGARVILCGRAPQRLGLARQFGVDAVINYADVPDQVAAVRALTDGQRGVDVAIEAVGRPNVWETTVAMVRKAARPSFMVAVHAAPVCVWIPRRCIMTSSRSGGVP